MVSKTVTCVVQVDEFPSISVTVNLTVFAPILLHVNNVLFKAKLAIPQLSELPLSMNKVLMLTLPPFAFNQMVVSL